MTDRILPNNLDELLKEIEREWNALIQVVDRLTPDQMTTPDSSGWSPKDNLGHLSAWMHFMLESELGGAPAHIALGIDEQKLKGMSEDEENAVLFERNRGRSTDEVLNELKSTHDETIKTLKAMGFPKLMKQFKSDDPQKRSVVEWVLGNTSEHFAEHRGYIERVVKANKS